MIGSRAAALLASVSVGVVCAQSPFVVSLHGLKHSVPGKAVKPFERGQKLLAKEEVDKAIVELRKAVAIDADFTEAGVLLGAAYLKSDQPDEAVSVLSHTVHVDPYCAGGWRNLAVGYIMLQPFDDAESAARRSIEAAHADSGAWMVLGMALVFQHKFTDEARIMLTRVQAEYPMATLLLAQISAARGNLADARSKITAYLDGGDDEARDKAFRWLAILDGKSSTASLAR